MPPADGGSNPCSRPSAAATIFPAYVAFHRILTYKRSRSAFGTIKISTAIAELRQHRKSNTEEESRASVGYVPTHIPISTSIAVYYHVIWLMLWYKNEARMSLCHIISRLLRQDKRAPWREPRDLSSPFFLTKVTRRVAKDFSYLSYQFKSRLRPWSGKIECI